MTKPIKYSRPFRITNHGEINVNTTIPCSGCLKKDNEVAIKRDSKTTVIKKRYETENSNCSNYRQDERIK